MNLQKTVMSLGCSASCVSSALLCSALLQNNYWHTSTKPYLYENVMWPDFKSKSIILETSKGHDFLFILIWAAKTTANAAYQIVMWWRCNNSLSINIHIQLWSRQNFKVFHRNVEKDEDFYFLGHNAVQSVESRPTFQRNMSCPPEDGDNMLLWNVMWLSMGYTELTAEGRTLHKPHFFGNLKFYVERILLLLCMRKTEVIFWQQWFWLWDAKSSSNTKTLYCIQ